MNFERYVRMCFLTHKGTYLNVSTEIKFKTILSYSGMLSNSNIDGKSVK